VNDVLEAYLRSTAKTWELLSDGTYARALTPDDTPALDIQAALLARATSDSEMVVPLDMLPKKYRKHLGRYGRVDPRE